MTGSISLPGSQLSPPVPVSSGGTMGPRLEFKCLSGRVNTRTLRETAKPRNIWDNDNLEKSIEEPNRFPFMRNVAIVLNTRFQTDLRTIRVHSFDLEIRTPLDNLTNMQKCKMLIFLNDILGK